jgi:hypothetical protein
MLAIKNQNSQLIYKFLEIDGIDVNTKSQVRARASANPCDQAASSLVQGRIVSPVTSSLLQRGFTPLMIAAWKGDAGVATKLISMKADLHAVDSGGRNAWGVAHDWHKEEVRLRMSHPPNGRIWGRGRLLHEIHVALCSPCSPLTTQGSFALRRSFSRCSSDMVSSTKRETSSRSHLLPSGERARATNTERPSRLATRLGASRADDCALTCLHACAQCEMPEVQLSVLQ